MKKLESIEKKIDKVNQEIKVEENIVESENDAMMRVTAAKIEEEFQLKEKKAQEREIKKKKGFWFELFEFLSK